VDNEERTMKIDLTYLKEGQPRIREFEGTIEEFKELIKLGIMERGD